VEMTLAAGGEAEAASWLTAAGWDCSEGEFMNRSRLRGCVLPKL
jgi:hypothetical protein